MLLVADSGSTKADWLLAENNKVIDSFTSMGFNPFFHNAETVYKELSKNKPIKKYASKIKEVKFFGAGCSSPQRNKIIAQGLKQVFPNAKILVDHDMLGAALAACNNKTGLVCILGTGSNIAYYDGKKLSETRHGLGYVLGDESSGSYYGKKLLAYFNYEVMPADLRKAFFAKYKMNKEKMIKHVYQLPDPNVYLASFAKFLSDYKNNSWIKQLVYKGMTDFFETNICAYPKYKTAPVHFIGSIAWFFKDTLQKVADENGFKVGKIIVKPIDELMSYFLKD
ncbi:MAG: N-acetylglucosamine kinase [Bacteroidota bacterium]